jgi:hypothetical protein
MRPGFQTSPHARHRQYVVDECVLPVVVTRGERQDGQSGTTLVIDSGSRARSVDLVS